MTAYLIIILLLIVAGSTCQVVRKHRKNAYLKREADTVIYAAKLHLIEMHAGVEEQLDYWLSWHPKFLGANRYFEKQVKKNIDEARQRYIDQQKPFGDATRPTQMVIHQKPTI